MDRLLKTPFCAELFQLTNGNIHGVDNVKIEELYRDFVNRVAALTQSCMSDPGLPSYWILHYTIVELQKLPSRIQKNTVLSEIIDKSVYMLSVALKWVKMELKANPANSHANVMNGNNDTKSMKWTGKVTDLVELAYALASTDCVNNGEVEIKKLLEVLSQTFHVEIKNGYQFYHLMKVRTGSRTLFIDTLKRSLDNRMNSEDAK